METEFTELSEPAFLLINVPLIVLNLAANIFYACCLIFPACNGRKLKQPLKVLLGYLVWCSIIYFVSLAGVYGVLKECENHEVLLVSWMLFMCYVHNSMMCSVWLNFYYYVHIVPSQQALLIWIKRNIRLFIYAVLLLVWMFFFILGVLTVVNVIFHVSESEFAYINGTRTEHHNDGMHVTAQVSFFIVKVPLFSCMCIMTFSCFSTAHYLHRHIRSVAQGGLSTPRLRSQIRVAITGISQGALCFFYAMFYFFDSFASMVSLRDLSAWTSFTVTSLYLSGTTVNLGVGQVVFRRRAAHVCRALRARCGVVGMVTNDVEIHSISLDMK